MKTLKRILRICAWTAGGLLGLVAIAALAGALWERHAEGRDADRFAPAGRLLDVGGGRMMHLDCRGTGEPIVLLEAGAQLWSSSWQRVHETLARQTRTCAYDRAGLGWSDLGEPPWDAHRLSDDLHRLLVAAGESPPYVWVGHSLGGMLASVYHERYRGELAAVVAIDSGIAEIVIEDFEARRDEPVRPCGRRCRLSALAARLGIVRWVLGRVELLDDPLLPAEAVAEFRALAARPAGIEAALATARYIPSIAFQTLDAAPITDIPVVTVYSGEYGSLLAESESEADLLEWRTRYIEGWRQMTRQSAAGRGPIAVPGANHLSVITYPQYAEQVASEVLAEVEALRQRRWAAGRR